MSLRSLAAFHRLAAVLLAGAASCLPAIATGANPRLPQGVALHSAEAQIEAGVWYDREHSGHGLDLYRQGDLLFGTFYTYDGRGAVQ